MAITTSLATRYKLKTIIMALVCIVLGLWGVWDYAVAIPKAEIEFSRAEILRKVKNGIDTPVGSSQRDEVIPIISKAIENNPATEVEWSESLELMRAAITGGSLALQQEAGFIVEEGLQLYGNVTPPSKYDRPMQWLFIICLPFGVYYFWGYMKMSKRARTYLLDDDGTLTTPDGTWTAEEITGIDMSRWIAKSGNARSTWTATALVENGSPQLLDDYIYQDMHLIIGKLAHQYYPEEWTPLAKRIKVEQPELTDEEK